MKPARWGPKTWLGFLIALCRDWGPLALALALWVPASLSADDGLRGRIDKILADPAAKRMQGGVCIVDVASAKVLYGRRADDLFTPASNMKLLTTAAALDQLGADFTYTTTFATFGDDLLVFGSGDPGLGDERLARRRNEPVAAPLLKVAAAMKRAGVRRVPGDIIVDATVFDSQFFHPNWRAEERERWYAAEVAGLNLNDNCLDIRLSPGKGGGRPVVELTPNTRYVRVINKARTDPKRHLVWFRREGLSNTFVAGGRVQKRMWKPHSMPIHNPPAFTARVLADVLAREGIRVDGKIRFKRIRLADGSLPGGLTVLARHEQLIGELLWRANTFSQNFVAEALFKTLGAYDGRSADPTGVGSWPAGRKAVRAFIRRRGLPAPAGLVIDDGSGLSKANRVSPALLATLLVKMADHESSELWFDSLATGGADGTLRKRFRGLDGGAKVLAKTGTLATAASLSGYVRTGGGREIAFSILFDRVRSGNVWRARRFADRIVRLLTGLDGAKP